MSMTHRERVFATLRHERPDRVALDGWFRPELIETLKDTLGTDKWEEALGLDWRGHVHCGVTWPAWDARTDLAIKDGYWPGAGGKYFWHDERTHENQWGIIHRIGEAGKYVEWMSGPLAGMEADEDEIFEKLEEVFSGYEFESVESIAKRVEENHAKGLLAIGGISMPFKTAWQLRGMEDWLCDYLDDPKFAHALLDKIYGYEQERAVRMAAAGCDIITVTGDIASKDALLFSHEVFEEFTKPRMDTLVKAARAASPHEHLYFFDHCDGNMSAVLPDLIDDLGFDIINPIQPECMDCYKVKEQYGDKITIHGTMSVVDLIPNGPVERIRKMVRERIDRLAYNGGFVLSSANVIEYDAPVENVIAMYEEARNYTSDKWPSA